MWGIQEPQVSWSQVKYRGRQKLRKQRVWEDECQIPGQIQGSKTKQNVAKGILARDADKQLESDSKGILGMNHLTRKPEDAALPLLRLSVVAC